MYMELDMGQSMTRLFTGLDSVLWGPLRYIARTLEVHPGWADKPIDNVDYQLDMPENWDSSYSVLTVNSFFQQLKAILRIKTIV